MRFLLMFSVLVLVLSEYTRAWEKVSRIVKTASGPVRGYKDPDFAIFTFYNIPYATAPTGPHKFQAPLPAPLWLNTIFDAVDRGIVCPQSDPIGFVSGKSAQEDCLVANVYVPDTDVTNLPVVVHVHGGAYQMGFGNMITPKHLVQSKKVIAVNFNYRLSTHGFLCLGTKDIPGNAGMKDQVALLRWVKSNIASFGGNPDDVTIDGFSAGSSAVDLIMLSKIARGLFSKVVPESGANVGVWSVQIDPLKIARKHAKKLNFSEIDDVNALEEFYKTADLKLIQVELGYEPDSTFMFVPCVERETSGEMFLDEAPVNILKHGKYEKLPMLYGFANMEGLFRVDYGFEEFVQKMNNSFSDFLPADLQFDSEEEKIKVSEELKKFYFNDKAISKYTIQGYIDYFGDAMFAFPTLRAVKLHIEAGHEQIYLYEYSYGADKDKDKLPTYRSDILKNLNIQGANHCAQSIAVLDTPFIADENVLSDEYRNVKAVMRELWLNFITTGAPVPPGSSLPTWPPTGADGDPHMSLDRFLRLRGPLLQSRMRFWHQIYEKHYRAPAPPPTPPPKQYSEL